MKITSVELRHVRQITELKLDLSAPLTLIGGPNGVGKSTLQQAILSGLFFSSKEMRESFISAFDPGNAPTVVLGLSQGKSSSRVSVTRSLLDDKGEWNDGITLLKAKKQALDKIKESLPISADAAAMLLWGRQDDMTAVLNTFPSDGHSLLTAAAIRGAGPDPKQIIKELEKEIDNAHKGQRGGKEVGALTLAQNKQRELEDELASATRAAEEQCGLRSQFLEAKAHLERVRQQSRELAEEIAQLESLDKLLDAAVKQIATRDEMLQTQREWDSLADEVATAGKDLEALKAELEHFRIQYRVARDEELAASIEALETRIKTVEALDATCVELEKDVKSRERPSPADVKAFEKLHDRIRQANDKMEATGVRYELCADSGPRTVRITEDNQTEKELTLASGQVYQGIVGRVTIEESGLRFTAAGKEDLSKFKTTVRDCSREMEALFKKFEVDGEASFLAAAKEKVDLNDALDKKRSEVKVQAGGMTLSALQTDLERRLAARTDNKMTLQDKEACAGKHLPAANEINNWCSQKSGAIQQATQRLAAAKDKQPSQATIDLQKRNLETIRQKAREAAAAFTDTDPQHREPTRPLQEEIRKRLATLRKEQARLSQSEVDAGRKVGDLSGQLKQVQPHRGLESIQADLEEAKARHRREHVLQEARALLKARIEEKVQTLAAHVPVELSEKVTRHLARLAGGWANHVALGPHLAVTHVSENGDARTWQIQQLSHGEQHQAALAVKIAVARALAEASGPMFVMLDDSLVSFDPTRRASTEEFLLEQSADGDLQIILLTCHTDWAADFKRRRPDQVSYIELIEHARYYRTPPAVHMASVGA